MQPPRPVSRTLKVTPWLASQLEALQLDPEFLAEDLVLDVCEQIAAAMEDQGLSQKALAERLGITPSAISQLLSGEQNVTLQRLVAVALALGRSVVPPRLVPLESVEIVEAEEATYSYSLEFSLEPDRVPSAWPTRGAPETGLHSAIVRHGELAVPESHFGVPLTVSKNVACLVV